MFGASGTACSSRTFGSARSARSSKLSSPPPPQAASSSAGMNVSSILVEVFIACLRAVDRVEPTLGAGRAASCQHRPRGDVGTRPALLSDSAVRACKCLRLLRARTEPAPMQPMHPVD
jgi:hypothetical protein